MAKLTCVSRFPLEMGGGLGALWFDGASSIEVSSGMTVGVVVGGWVDVCDAWSGWRCVGRGPGS